MRIIVYTNIKQTKPSGVPLVCCEATHGRYYRFNKVRINPLK